MLIPGDVAFPLAHASLPDTSARPDPSYADVLGRALDRALAPFDAPKTRQLERDRAGESELTATIRELAAVIKLVTHIVDGLEAAVAVLSASFAAGLELSAATTFTSTSAAHTPTSIPPRSPCRPWARCCWGTASPC